MKTLLVLFGLLLTNTLLAQHYVQLTFLSTRDSVNFEPVRGVVSCSWHERDYSFSAQHSDENGHSYKYVTDSILKNNILRCSHSEYTFPEQRVIDYPYEIRHGWLNILVVGIPIPDQNIDFILADLAQTGKHAETDITLRYLPKNPSDSLILLSHKGKFLGSYTPMPDSSYHIIHSVNKNEFFPYGQIVNLTSGDTVKHEFKNWNKIMAEVDLQPIQRAPSEANTLLYYLDFIQNLHNEHQAEVDSLNRRIDHLEDSIADILNPNRHNWILGGPINVPAEGIIDGVFIQNKPNIALHLSREERKQKMLEIIERHNPKKSGMMAIEIRQERDGSRTYLELTDSEEYRNIQKEIIQYLDTLPFDTKTPYGHRPITTELIELHVVKK